MKVDEVEPEVDQAALLAGAQFVDAFRIAVEGRAFDPRHAPDGRLALPVL